MTWFGFFTRFLGDHRHVGAVLPSSRALARAMTSAVGKVGVGELIVELGPGTGAITQELVRAFPKTKLVLIEREKLFANELRAQFPQAQVVQGNAEDLVDLLKNSKEKPKTVVSGLPMLSLPESVRNGVFSALEHVLTPGARFIQFTYGPAAWKHLSVPGFRLVSQKRVWGNIPPATVLTFERK